MKPDKGYITCWAIVLHAPYGYVIIGHHGMENYSFEQQDHKSIRTSPIVKMIKTGDGFVVETENSIYHILGFSNDSNGRLIYRYRYQREPGELRK